MGTVSVLDHDAFVAKHIPDLYHNIKELKVFHWNLQGWKQLEKNVTSPEFDCGGHRWGILLFPLGNAYAPNDTVSLFLECTGSKDSEKDDWHVCAQFALAISNSQDPTISTVSYARHRFIPKQTDWGFTRFSELRKLLHPQPSQNRPTIEEDSVVISVYVRVLEDTTGVLWHDFIDYDSKKQTGYVGLKNQGATGYMNTMLQSLFCTNSFRKAVYKFPTGGQCPTESVLLALQRVFYNLQTSNQSVATTELTKSFGWNALDSFLPHDVVEFYKVLQEKLEHLMKGTPAQHSISNLFVGKMKTFIKCVNVTYEFSRIEDFSDIELRVKGINTLRDSFRDYTAVETLDGEDKVQTEGFGLQKARKGLIFQAFPPILYLSLNRFEYDSQRDSMLKIHDRFEFPFEIDLGEFLDESADRSKPWRYRLHSVLVHSGDCHGGRYFAIVKPDKNTRWLKFDDDRVTPVTDREVLEENYGGEPLGGFVPQTRRNQIGASVQSTNARMLVYIRESADEILAPLAQEDVPSHLKQGLEGGRPKTEAKKTGKEKELQDPFLTAKIITDATFSQHNTFDLAVFDNGNQCISNLPTFRVSIQDTYSIFKSRVAQHFNYPENQFRLWVLVNRANKTVRPDTCVPENEPSLTLEMVRNRMVGRQTDLRFYLDFFPDPSMKLLLEDAGTVMVFVKHFDATEQKVVGVGKFHVPRARNVSVLIPIINGRMRWASGTPLKLYEEIKPDMVELMEPNRTLAQSDIQDGDIVCFQLAISDKEARDLESKGLCSNPQQFYKTLQNQMIKH